MSESPRRMPADAILLVGLGSLRGDDSVGLCIASELAEQELPGVRVRMAHSPTQLFDWLDGLQHLIICDACVSSEPAGQLHRWTWPSDDLEHLKFSGSHDVSLPTVLAIAERLEQLPPSVTIWGVAIAADQVTLTDQRGLPATQPHQSGNSATALQPHTLLSPEILIALPAIVTQIRAAIPAA